MTAPIAPLPWAALNAVTRWVDHNRTNETLENGVEKAFLAAQFGSGSQIKAKAMGLLIPRIKDKVLLAA